MEERGIGGALLDHATQRQEQRQLPIDELAARRLHHEGVSSAVRQKEDLRSLLALEGEGALDDPIERGEQLALSLGVRERQVGERVAGEGARHQVPLGVGGAQALALRIDRSFAPTGERGTGESLDGIGVGWLLHEAVDVGDPRGGGEREHQRGGNRGSSGSVHGHLDGDSRARSRPTGPPAPRDRSPR